MSNVVTTTHYMYQGPLGQVVRRGVSYFASKDGFPLGTYSTFSMRAHELLNSPETWCKESPAADEHGNKLQAFDPRAVKWCALAAIQKAYPSSQWGEAMDRLLRYPQLFQPWIGSDEQN